MDAAGCDGATLVPYTLLGFLLWGNMANSYRPAPTDCSVRLDWLGFIKDYAQRAINALLWIALVSAIALLLGRIYRLLRLWALGGKIPGPPFASFVRHSGMVNCGGDATDYLSKLHEKYGNIVKVWLSPTQLLVSVRDPPTIQEVLTIANDKLPLTGRIFRFAFGRSSLFVSTFEKVNKRRESLALFLNKKFLELATVIPSKVVDCVLKRVDFTTSAESLNCWSFSQHLAFYTLGVTIFGDAFLTWSNATIYEDLLMKIAKDASFWVSYNIVPVWKRDFWKYQFLSWRFKYLTNDIIRHCDQSQNSYNQLVCGSYNKAVGIGKESCESNISLGDMTMEGLIIKDIYQHLISKEEPSGNVMGLMFHGYLRTVSLISNVLTRLVLHPELQDQIYSDIAGLHKELSQSGPNIENLQLLLAAVYESARLLPTRPLLQRCSYKYDLSLDGGIKIPAGAVLVVPVRLVHMDTSIWGTDAFDFNPQRFFSKFSDGNVNIEGKRDSPRLSNASITGDQEGPRRHLFHQSEMKGNVAFLPFGYGTRICSGQNLVVREISNLLVYLLQNYKIALQPGSENDPKPALKDCVMQLLPSPKIHLVKRNS